MLSRPRVGLEHGKQLVFQMQALLLAFFEVVIARRLCTGFNAVNFMIHLMVLLEQARKVRIAHFEFMDRIVKFGELVVQVVFLGCHRESLLCLINAAASGSSRYHRLPQRKEHPRMPKAASFKLTQRHIQRGLKELAEREPHVARALERVGYPEPRRRPHGFDALSRIIVGQQVSVQAARAIANRLEACLGGEICADAVLATDNQSLRAAGLSGQKVRYLRALSEAVRSGALPVHALPEMPDEAVVEHITAITGFGEWSAHMYLMFSLGRTDVWPVGDLAVRAGFGRIMAMSERPTPKQTRDAAEHLAPYRSALALLCWKFYSEAPL